MAVCTSKVVTIDKIEPIVMVVYDNNPAISTLNGRQYFDSNRKATVTVIEHNFRESDFVNTIVAQNVAGDDVVGAVVEKWTKPILII